MVLRLEAAAMAEVPVAEAGDAVATVLAARHYGLGWGISIAGLMGAGLLAALTPASTGTIWLLVISALSAFWYGHCMNSHWARWPPTDSPRRPRSPTPP
jgi:putative copper resistance protein D